MENSIEPLKAYFSKTPDVLLGFIFGSYAQGRAGLESDFDVTVYFKPKEKTLEQGDVYESEDEIRSAVTRIVKKEVDLVCLNDAPASLISSVIKTGIPLSVKDKRLYWELYLTKSQEAEDFLHFMEGFSEIKQKAMSLIPEERERLLARLDYLKDELTEIERFRALSWEEYSKDKDKRKIIERWTENILNATIDIAKIVLASEKKSMPKTYEEALCNFGVFTGLTQNEANKFLRFANLKNILAHEYLNILYERIQNFIKEAPPLYRTIFSFLEKYLATKK